MAPRTITQPANGSALDSSVVRGQLQILENEIASSSSIDPGHLHTAAGLDTTGTPSSTTFLNGDFEWVVPDYGTVKSVSVVSANGMGGSVASSTINPAITLTTSVVGLVKGNGVGFSAAVANTDYQSPITLTTIGTGGPATFNGTTLNIPDYQASAFNLQVKQDGSSYIQNVDRIIFDGAAVTDGGGGIITVTVSPTGLVLETDGVPNGDQTLLNLKAGTNITLTDDGVGGVTIDASGNTGVSSVVGTSNRITVDSTDPANPIVDIAATYVGQASITTLGTIGTGTWAGTTIAVNHGGTGGTVAGIALFNNITGYTAAGATGTTSTNLVFSTSPTLVTPTLGVATATSINKLTITAPASGSTLTIADGKTLTVSNTLTFTGTDSSSVAFGAGGTVLYTASTIPLTIGSTTITSGTSTRILYDNGGVLGEYTLTGTGTVVAMQTNPTLSGATFTDATNIVFNTTTGTKIGTGTSQKLAFYNSTPVIQQTGDVATALSTLGLVATPTVLATTISTATEATDTTCFPVFVTASGTQTLAAKTNTTLTYNSNTNDLGVTKINGLTLTASTGTFTLTNAKTLSVTNSLTLSGTDSTTMTFPSTTATIARTDAAQTFTGTQTFSQVITTANAITASSNAATIPVTSRHNIVTNDSAGNMTITLTTASAVNMQTVVVQILDFSAVAKTITWVNTENSTVTPPATSNGSTSLPVTVGFMYNSSTSKWRCIASA